MQQNWLSVETPTRQLLSDSLARAWCVSAVTCYNGHQNKHCSHMWGEKGLRHHQDHVCMISAILKSLWIWSGVWIDRSGFLFHMRLRSSLRLLPHSDRWEQQRVKSNDLKKILFCKVQYNKVADETGVASVICNLVQCKQRMQTNWQDMKHLLYKSPQTWMSRTDARLMLYNACNKLIC